MRVRIQRRGFLPAVVVTIVGVVALYLASTWGWALLQGGVPGPSGTVGTLPAVVERPPESVATTGDYGPVGPVSMVFAGTHVRDGLFGDLDPAWVAVSSRNGEYRALEVDDLPPAAAGAISVSPTGDLLAWVGGSGIVIYDPAIDESTTFSVPGATDVGAFSPRSHLLLAGGAGLVVIDTESGRVVSRFDAPADVVHRAAWRPDGSAVDFVYDGQLVTAAVPGSRVSRQATDLPGRAQLAWSPSGDKLASLQPVDGARRLFVSEASGDRLSAARPVPVPNTSLQQLLGFSSSDSVTVIAYALESGSVQRVMDLPLGPGTVTDVTTLPDPGENWVGAQTLAVATDTLTFGSTDFDNRVWPWSHTARLVASVLTGVFLLGLFVTRRPR